MATLVLRGLFTTLVLLAGLFTARIDGGPIGLAVGTPAFAQQECTTPRAAVGRAEQQQFQQWCRQTAARDVQGSARAAQGAAGSTLAAAGGPAEVWCPTWSTQCYCWQGKHYNGCSNFAAHCKDSLTCGTGGKICSCTSN